MSGYKLFYDAEENIYDQDFGFLNGIAIGFVTCVVSYLCIRLVDAGLDYII